MFKEHAIIRASDILKHLNNHEAPIFNKECLAALGIMPNAFISYETSIQHSLDELQKRNNIDYELLDKLFFNIKLQISIYLLDLEKLSYFWFIFFKGYYNSKNTIQKMDFKSNIYINNNNFIDSLILQVLDKINLFNKVGREKIIYVHEFIKLQEKINRFSKTYTDLNTQLRILLTDFPNRTNENNSLIMLRIIHNLNDLVIELEVMHTALIKVVDFYNRKAY